MATNEESIAHLKQEVKNFTLIRDEYLAELQATFPHLTETDFVGTSAAYKTFKERIQRYNIILDRITINGSTYYHYPDMDDNIFSSIKKRYKAHSSEKLLEALKQLDSLFYGNYRWGVPNALDAEFLEKTKRVPLALYIYYFDKHKGQICRSKERRYWFESLLIEPKFSVGDIVSIRSNPTDNAIKYEFQWSEGHGKDLRTLYPDESFMNKTFMVLAVENKKSRYYEKAYKPNANGGMRRYKVLPIGDTTVYWIIERALKKNRTKAVKDAKRT